MNKNIFTKASLSDEDFKPCDYTTLELEEMTKSSQSKKLSPKKKKQSDTNKFKQQYFAYYDDIKSSSLKKQDW